MLFFVNADNITEKTKDNFLNANSSKSLLNKNIYFKGKQVAVTMVDNFEGVNANDINIRFTTTTIQKLHSDLTTAKENALTFDDFKKKKIVLLSDENHDAERIAKAEEWFAFNGLYGTSEEKAFVQFLQTHLEKLQKIYDGVYLIRNERHFYIYNFFDGKAFQPDFVLFFGKENGETLSYQLFIEPKVEHIEDFDRWKENFLKEIDTELIIEDKNYRIIGLPFYQEKNENEFRETLDEALQL